jgi:hypothetical protein
MASYQDYANGSRKAHRKRGARPATPAKTASSLSSASMRSNRFHFAVRSDRMVEPTLICRVCQATARSASQLSSLSPERADSRVANRGTGLVDHAYGVGERAGLVRFHQYRVGDPVVDATGQPGRVGDEQIVAEQLDARQLGRRDPQLAQS